MIPGYESWEVVRKIGSGSYGKVYEIQKEDFGYVYKSALKVITISKDDSDINDGTEDETRESQAERYEQAAAELVKEFEIMSKLDGNTNIVDYKDHSFRRHEDGVGFDIFIRMELLTSLNQYMKEHPLTRRDIIRLGIDMCQALERCQKFHIIHRDIKPANIFVSDQGDFKLGDFGIAKTVEKHAMFDMSQKGTLNYMAPEVRKGQPYGFDVDMYSLGIVMYRLLNNNRLPFVPSHPSAHDREMADIKRIGGEPLPFPEQDHTRLAEIILKACSYDPKNRYSSPTAMKEDLQAILYTEEECIDILKKEDVIHQPGEDSISDNGSKSSGSSWIYRFFSKKGEYSDEDKTQILREPEKGNGLLLIAAIVVVVFVIVVIKQPFKNNKDSINPTLVASETFSQEGTDDLSRIDTETSSVTEKDSESSPTETEENKGPRTTSEVGDAGITINKEYDSNNNMIRENQIHPDGTQGLSYEYTYPEWVKDDEKHENWLTETSYHADGKLWTYSEREYEKEQMIKQSDYDSDHQMTAYAVYEWNEEGKKSGYTEYLPDDTVVKIHSFTYESNGSYKEKVEPGDYGLGNTPAIVGSVPIGFIVNEYNVSGQQVKELDYNEDGELLLSCQYKYDYVKVNDQFRTTQQDWILADGTVVSHAEYQYNDEGNTTDVILFDAKGKIMTYTTYENNPNGEVTISQYDENHSILRRDEYDEEGTLINTVSYGTYEEDQQKDN